jgi:MFS family permease
MALPARPPHTSSFQYADFRCLLTAIACSTLASRGLAVILGYQVFALTKNPLSLGMLGLVEAIPALSLALYGGHIADRHDRRTILRCTLLISVVCAAAFAGIMATGVGTGGPSLTLMYAVVFVAGMARGFAEPAAAALEAQTVPLELLVHSSTLYTTAWLACAVAGPVVAGFVFAHLGAVTTYSFFALLFGAAWLAVSGISPKPVEPSPHHEETIWQSIAVGVRYVTRDQVLLGSMALDLFAVLFGGAIAILPVFASEILHVGTTELGFLTAAPNAGALVTMLIATRHPPVKHAGRNLLLAVAGFGVSMIVFAFSTNLYLSLVALTFSGIFDGVSVVIRRFILRVMSPDHLRGRIAAVSMVFIGSSNEIGAFESGMAASALGTRRSVWLGGIVTLMIVTGTSLLAPRLRRLRFSSGKPVEKPEEVADLLG